MRLTPPRLGTDDSMDSSLPAPESVTVAPWRSSVIALLEGSVTSALQVKEPDIGSSTMSPFAAASIFACVSPALPSLSSVAAKHGEDARSTTPVVTERSAAAIPEDQASAGPLHACTRI